MPAPTPTLEPTIISASAAAQMISSGHPPLIIDARHPSLHEFERVQGAIPPPSACTISSLKFQVAIVYDCGATTLQPPHSRGVTELHRLRSIVPCQVRLHLIEGGLCAIRSIAQHLIVGPSAQICKSSIPPQLLKFPWAVRAFQAARLERASPARILPSLYVGSVTHASDSVWLKRHDVTHVLAVGEEFTSPEMSQYSFEWCRIGVRDHRSEAISPHFMKAICFLDDARAQRGTTLVHCLAGASRSVATVMAYLIFHGWTFVDALEHIKSLRPAANPNGGFLTQLEHWASVCEGKRKQQHIVDVVDDAQGIVNQKGNGCGSESVSL